MKKNVQNSPVYAGIFNGKPLVWYTVFALFLQVLAYPVALAQERSVQGKVTSSEDGSAMPGVSVVIKGTTTGTATDASGNYQISIPTENAMLIFSFIGFGTEEIAVGSRTTLDVPMKVDTKQLSELVVTALGIQKDKAKVGYATQEVDGGTLVKAREPNVLNTLVGKVAGLTVAPSAELLGPPNLLLRGSAPLFVVDGVPINSDTWNISADDVETYTVLKGPSASALYGYRGQFGAIMITTKRGSKDKRGFSVEVNSSTQLDNGFIAIPEVQDLYGPGDHGKYAFVDGRGGGLNDTDYDVWGPKFEGQPIPQYDSPVIDGVRQATPWVARGKDNLKRFIRTGILSTNNIAVSSSTDKYDLRFSASHSHQRGIVPNTQLNITNFNLSAGFNFSPKLRFESNINFNRQYTPNYPDVQYGPNSMIYNMTIWGGADWNVDDMKNYWQPGKEGVQQQYAEYTRYNNPYFLTNEWLRGHYKTDIYGYMSLKYQFSDFLNLAVRTQATTYDLLRTERFPTSATVYGREQALGDYREDRRNLIETNSDLLLTFNKNISSDFSLNASVGGAYRNFNYNSSYVSTDYLNVPASSVNPSGFSFSNSRNPIIANSFRAPMEVASAYGLFDLTFRNFLTLSATGRLDALSTLLKNPYFYPSVSLSAVLSDVIKMPDAISFLKLRGSFANVKGGLTQKEIGIRPGASYPLAYGSEYKSSFEGPSYENSAVYSTPLMYNNQTAAYFTNTLNNPNIKPFSRTNYEGGIDVRFLQNRLGLDVNYFVYNDGPQIFKAPISEGSGYDTQLINGVKTRKTGWEATLTGSPVRTAGGFNWDVLVNWSTFKEVYTELPPGVDVLDNFYRVGDRTDAYYGRAFARVKGGEFDGQIINDASGRPLRYQRNQFLGNANPDWVWGINNRFSYKGFTFSFQFDGRVGGKMVNYIQQQTFRGGRHIATVEGAMAVARENDTKGIKSWTGEGVTLVNGGNIQYDPITGLISNYSELTFVKNTTPTYLQDYISTYYNTNEGNLISKTYAKLREVTIGYNIPAKFLGKSFIRTASITLVGRNLLYFSKAKDVDIDQYADKNYSTLQTPTTRRYGINLNFTF